MIENANLLNRLLHDKSFVNWAKNNNSNDVAYWNAWIRNNQEHIDIVETAKSIVLGINFKPTTTISPETISVEFTEVTNKLHLNNDDVPQTKTYKLAPYIATFCGVAAMLLIGFFLNNTATSVTHKTDFGEFLNLTLPDGTSVILNGNSEISYQKNEPRDINLKGEAYFKVKSIPSTHAKFWVTTKDLKVEVYGTQFLVNTREKKTDVVLDEGSVHLLLNDGNSQQMQPGDKITYSENKASLIKKKVDTALSYAHWTDGTFEFNNLKLKSVMKYIEQTYGKPAVFVDTVLQSRDLSGGIPAGNLRICLKAIEKVTATKIVEKDNKLYIYSN